MAKADPFVKLEIESGIYGGDGKPSDLDAFLGPLVTEMKQLEQGLILNNATDLNDEKVVHVKLRAFICDSPARAMIKDDEEFIVYKMLEGAEDIILNKEEDPLLSLSPVVFTTRLDEMNTIKNDLTNLSANEILKKLLSESKPIANTDSIKPSPTTENRKSFKKLVDILTDIFKNQPQLLPNDEISPNEMKFQISDDDIPLTITYDDGIFPNTGTGSKVNEEENTLNSENIESFSGINFSHTSDIKNVQLIPEIHKNAFFIPNMSTASSINTNDDFKINKESRPCYVVLEDIKTKIPANQLTVKLPLKSNPKQLAIELQHEKYTEVKMDVEIDETSDVDVEANSPEIPIGQVHFESNTPTNENNSSSENPEKHKTEPVKTFAAYSETKGRNAKTTSSRTWARKRKHKIIYEDGSSDEEYVPDKDDAPIIKSNVMKKPKTKSTLKTVQNVSTKSNKTSNYPVVTVLTSDTILSSFQEKYTLVILIHKKETASIYRLNPTKLVTDYYVTRECDDYKLAAQFPKEEKIFERFCCWYKREEVVDKICSRRNYPFTITKFLKQPHSCHIDECLCCCQTTDSSQCYRGERRAVISKALTTADMWITELFNKTEPATTGLLSKALTYTPKIKEKPIEKEPENYMVNCLLCIKNASPKLMYELYEIGQNGDVFRLSLLYDKDEVECIRKMYQSNSMPIKDAVLCCRFKREKLMHELKMLKTSPAALKHIRKAHRCNSECNCCCKPLPTTLLAVQALPAKFKHTTAYSTNPHSITIHLDEKSKKVITKENCNKSKNISNSANASTADGVSEYASKDDDLDQSVSLLTKFKHLAVNSDGELEAVLNEPANKLSVDELKQLSDKLALYKKQQLMLGLSAEEFCNRINLKSADSTVIHVTPPEATLIRTETLAPLPLKVENDNETTDVEDEYLNVEGDPIYKVPNQTISTLEKYRIKTQTKPSHTLVNSSIYKTISELMEAKNKNYVDSFKLFFNETETSNDVVPNAVNSTPIVDELPPIIDELPMPIIKETFTLANTKADFAMPGPSGVTSQGSKQSDGSVNNSMTVHQSVTHQRTNTQKRKLENVINTEIENKIRVKPPSELIAPILPPLANVNSNSISAWPRPVVIKREPETNIPLIVRPVGSLAITNSQSLQKQTYIVTNNAMSSNLNIVGSTPITVNKVFQMNGNPIQVSNNTAFNANGANVRFIAIAPQGRNFDASKKTMLANILKKPQTPVFTSSGTYQMPPLVPIRVTSGLVSGKKETSDQTQVGKSKTNTTAKKYKK